jgi:hypothetical protein
VEHLHHRRGLGGAVLDQPVQRVVQHVHRLLARELADQVVHAVPARRVLHEVCPDQHVQPPGGGRYRLVPQRLLVAVGVDGRPRAALITPRPLPDRVRM